MPWGARLRRYFLVGLVVIAPVGLTVFILRLIFDTIDDILGSPLRAALGFRIPGLGFVLLALVVLVVGWIVHQGGRAPRASLVEPGALPISPDRTDLQRREPNRAEHGGGASSPVSACSTGSVPNGRALVSRIRHSRRLPGS